MKASDLAQASAIANGIRQLRHTAKNPLQAPLDVLSPSGRIIAAAVKPALDAAIQAEITRLEAELNALGVELDSDS